MREEWRDKSLPGGGCLFSALCWIYLPTLGSKESQWGQEVPVVLPVTQSLPQVEKVPVGEHRHLGPGSAETAAQGVDSSVGPGTQLEELYMGVSKYPFSLLKQREDELRPEQPLDS